MSKVTNCTLLLTVKRSKPVGRRETYIESFHLPLSTGSTVRLNNDALKVSWSQIVSSNNKEEHVKGDELRASTNCERKQID